jgi:(p)ppGpp synthase/HD superfamily hydrolase
MSSEDCFFLLRLRVVADADPHVLARVIERFQNLNVVPRRVSAEFGINDVLHITVDVFGVPEDQLALIANKLSQVPSIVNARWHRLH